MSLPEHPSKRKKISADASPNHLPSTGSSRKERVTYGKKSKSIHSSNAANDEADVPATKDTGPNFDTNWPLEGTMQDYYAQHDPNMFPEPSSTVPNATYTQQRVLETVTAPALLGLESELDAPRYQPPPDGSVPWSDLLKFSPVATAEQSDPSNQPADPESTEAAHKTAERSQMTPSQRSRRGSSVRLRGSPLRNEILPGDVDPKEVMPPPTSTTPSQDLGLPSTATRHSQNNGQKDSRQSSQQQKSKVSSVPNSEDDFAAIGLPKEQYVPRPSRSRSLKVGTQEPVDYSVRPEKATKATKRRKTTAAITRSSNVVDLLATPQKIRQICDMGFTPTSTGRALEQNSGDVTQTVDWLISNGMGEDELAHNTPKKKVASKAADIHHPVTVQEPSSTTQSSARNTSTNDDTGINHNPGVAIMDDIVKMSSMDETSIHSDTVVLADGAQVKSPKVQVVIPSKSPKPKPPLKLDPPSASSKKAKRRKTTLDVPEAYSTLEPPAVPSVTNEKKKGRGRPKKTANAAPASVIEEVPPEGIREPERPIGGVLQTTEPNALVPESNEAEHEDAITTATSEQPPTTTTQSKNTSSTVSSRTPEPSTKLTSKSPASKGKVSYRVGLSKRARIAPLLRTLKK